MPHADPAAQARQADCVILTRFNLPSQGVESMIRAQDGWLRNRVVLFEQYCVPAVLAQTDPVFRWIIYFDPQSPAWLLERIAPYVEAGTFTAVYRESVSADDLAADIASAVGTQRCPAVITIGLDNDDALATDFIARARAVDTAGACRALYFENGLIRSGELLYLHRDPVNAFPTVMSPWDPLMTCWQDWHILLGQHMPVAVVGGAPAWLQVVHGQNVSNRIRGRLTSPALHRARFPSALAGMPEPAAASRLVDLLLARPMRFTCERVRAGVKGTAMRLLGRDGWSRAKHLWRSVRLAVPGRSAR